MSSGMKTKRCAGKHGCGRVLPRSNFRLLSHGHAAAYCRSCERAWDRERWHRRDRRPDGSYGPTRAA